VYAALVLVVDAASAREAALASAPDSSSSSSSSSSSTPPPPTPVSGLNAAFIALAALHFVNAMQYWASWVGPGSLIFSAVALPDLCNAVSAVLYFSSSLMYRLETRSADGDEWVGRVRRTEAAAAAVQLLASIGWMLSWRWNAPAPSSAAAWALDPDLYANTATLVASTFYAVTSAAELVQPEGYINEGILVWAVSR
jgi:hypothetical protein